MERKIYLSNTPLSRAQEIFWKAALKKELESVELPTTAAAGRITAEPVFARLSLHIIMLPRWMAWLLNLPILLALRLPPHGNFIWMKTPFTLIPVGFCHRDVML